MRVVKGNKELKSIWSAGRRAITPKIGQLTNDMQAIQRIVSLALGSMKCDAKTPHIDARNCQHRSSDAAASASSLPGTSVLNIQGNSATG